uniref:Uncharacterized protein n=1 Tax=viral metagenome TaxID=1070528 RepID=A0A6C0IP21_9ZZZZ
MKFKITPLTIFLLLLVVLVVLIVFNNSTSFQKEGFVSFLQSEPAASRQTVPQYNPNEKVYKLYDNLYFDNKNGSLVELTSSEFTGNVDMIGNTITQMSVMPRSSSVAYTYELTSATQKIAPPTKSLVSSYTPLIYDTDGTNTDKYSVLYMPWGKKTFLHVLDTTTSPITNEASFLFSDTSVVYSKILDGSEIYIEDYKIDADEHNNTDVSVPMYNSARKVHQLNKFVHYDMKNGSLLLSSGEEGVDVYKRGDTNKIAIHKTSADDVTETKFGDDDEYKTMSFDVQMHQDKMGGNTVMVFSQSFETMVVIVGKDANGNVTIKNLKRFNPNGIDDGSTLSSTGEDDNTQKEEDNEDDGNEKDTGLDINDYILKTQIVPPVCPACPACDFTGACSNCGGNGGSGTLTQKGNSTVEGDAVSKKSAADVATGTVGAVGDVASGTVDVAGDVATGTVGAVGDVATGTVGAVGDVASGTVGAVGDVATGAVGAAGGIASSALGAVGDVAAGIVGAGKKVTDAAGAKNNTNNTEKVPQDSNKQMTQVMPQGNNDPYSYYGQLPYKKPNEYMPITADFSSFGK